MTGHLWATAGRAALAVVVSATTLGCIVDSDPTDAGSLDDAGQTADAGPIVDASTVVDAWPPPRDAGPISDGGLVDAFLPLKDGEVIADAAPADAAPSLDAGPVPDAHVLPDEGLVPDLGRPEPVGTLIASAPEVNPGAGAPVRPSKALQYTVFPESIDGGQVLAENPAQHDFTALACSDAGLFGIVRARTRPNTLALRRLGPNPQVFAPFFDMSQGGRRQSGIVSGLLACDGQLWVTTPELLNAPTFQPPRLWTIDPADGTPTLVEALRPDEDVGDLTCVDDVVYAAIKNVDLRTTSLVRLNPRQDIGAYFDATGQSVGGAATHGAAYCDGTYYVSTPRLGGHAPGTVDQPSRILAVDLADASTQVVIEDAEADFADMVCLNDALYAVRVQHGPGRGTLVRVTPAPSELGQVFTTEGGFFVDGNYSALAVCD